MRESILKDITRVITHGNCPDGMASAILLNHALGIEPEFMIHGTDEYKNMKATPGMVFCDITPPEDRVDEFIEAGAIVLDHHIGAKDLVARFGERGVFAHEDDEPGVSGAPLAFREVWAPLEGDVVGAECRQKNAERFAKLAGVRDTWQLKDDCWVESCHQAATLTFYPWEHWKEKLDSHFDFSIKEEMIVGELIFNNRLAKAGKCAAEAFKTPLTSGLRVAIFNDPDKLTSDVSEILRGEGINVIGGFFYSKKSMNDRNPVICFSLRSDGTFDVSKFAATFGGGGHSRAAGYSKPYTPKHSTQDPFSLFMNDLEDYVAKSRK